METEKIATHEESGLTAWLVHDDTAGNPRKEHDNVWTILTDLRDEINIDGKYDPERHTFEQLRAEEGAALVVPVFIFRDWANTYHCEAKQAGSQCGVAYLTEEALKEEWGEGPEATEKAIAYLKGELEVYTVWAGNDVKGWDVRNREGGIVDSCGGIYDSDTEYAESEAKAALEDAVDEWKREQERILAVNLQAVGLLEANLGVVVSQIGELPPDAEKALGRLEDSIELIKAIITKLTKERKWSCSETNQ